VREGLFALVGMLVVLKVIDIGLSSVDEGRIETKQKVQSCWGARRWA